MHCWPPRSIRRSASMSHWYLRPALLTQSNSGHVRSQTSSQAASAGIWKLFAFMICASRRTFRSGAAECSRPASVEPPTPLSLHCPASPSLATSAHRHASTRRTIVTDPITITDGHVTVPTSPGLGFDLDKAFLDQVTTPHDHAPLRVRAIVSSMTHAFLSNDWMDAARGIREKYSDQVPEIPNGDQDQPGDS